MKPLDSVFIILWAMACVLTILPYVVALIGPPIRWLVKRCGIVVTLHITDSAKSFWEKALHPAAGVIMLFALFFLQILLARIGLVTGPGKPW